MILVGHANCLACGVRYLVAVPLDGIQARFDDCDDCGEPNAVAIPVWFPAALFPDSLGLLEFHYERRRLKLPTLEGSAWQ